MDIPPMLVRTMRH